MDPITIVTEVLKNNSGVVAITGFAGIYPIEAPQTAAPPYVVSNISAGFDTKTLQGAGKYYRHRITVTSIAVSGTAVLALGNAVLAALQNIIKARILQAKDVDILFADMDVTDNDDQRVTFRRLLDFNVQWRDA